MERNIHGLPREIEARKKRLIRRECGFGCVVCGAIGFDYAHVDPPFEHATSHEVSNIALLCDAHHTAFDRHKTLSLEAVKSRRLRPYNLEHDPTWTIFSGTESICMELGGQLLCGPDVSVEINDVTLLRVRSSSEADAPWHMEGAFCTSRGVQSLRFEDGAIVAPRGAWDVELTGNALTLREASRMIVVRLVVDTNSGSIAVERLHMSLANGHELIATSDHLEIAGPDVAFVMGVPSKDVRLREAANAAGLDPLNVPNNIFMPGAQCDVLSVMGNGVITGAQFRPSQRRDRTILRFNDESLGDWSAWTTAIPPSARPREKRVNRNVVRPANYRLLT